MENVVAACKYCNSIKSDEEDESILSIMKLQVKLRQYCFLNK